MKNPISCFSWNNLFFGSPIDSKGDEKETGYFKGRVDTFKRVKILEMSPTEAVLWVKGCFSEFQNISGSKLIILDQGTAVCSKFKNTKGEINWLKDKIISYCSCGDSSGWHFWIVVQNPHTDDLGISGGLRSQLTSVALVHPDNVPAYNAMIATQLIPSDRKITSTQVMEIAASSPVGRAVYYGGVNQWFPMPQLKNSSPEKLTLCTGRPHHVNKTSVLSINLKKSH
ncbi:hypothetical protein [uncultured Nostoc sp.]|uniref:hypothetical protein n=1 Tax=uncultured Nostoc sp. TaxID=340711 RepID=UPI0035CA8FA2